MTPSGPVSSKTTSLIEELSVREAVPIQSCLQQFPCIPLLIGVFLIPGFKQCESFVAKHRWQIPSVVFGGRVTPS
jgi:hypothetical protein